MVFTYAFFPIISGFAHHSRDQVDINLRKVNGSGEFVRPDDFLRPVRASVRFEDLVVEILDSQAEARYTQILDYAQFAFGQRARFSHSNVISSACSQESRRFISSTSRVSCS